MTRANGRADCRWLMVAIGCALAACSGQRVGSLAGTGGAGAIGGFGGARSMGSTGGTAGATGVGEIPGTDGGSPDIDGGHDATAGAGGFATGGGGGGAALGGAAGQGGGGGGAGTPGVAGATGFAPCPSNGDPCVVLPLGDSITWGYGSTTGGGYRVSLFSEAVAENKSLTFVGSQMTGPDTVGGKPFSKGNEGHSGYSIADNSKTNGIAGALTDTAIATYKPNIILLMIGTNDMHDSIDLANAPMRLGALIDEILADAPKALLVVATIIPANGVQNTPTQTYNAAIPGVVRARSAQGKHITLVDMYAAMGTWSTAIYKDSEHPNDAGYTIMARTWYPAISALLR